MGFDNLFFQDFKKLDFPCNTDMVYVIGVQDDRKGFCPFYVGKSSNVMGRMGDYTRAHFDLSSLPDFHVGWAIRFFQCANKKVEVKYKPSKDMSQEENEWKKKLRLALGNKFQLLTETLFQPFGSEGEEKQKVRMYCEKFLNALDDHPMAEAESS
jgi:hypothetical protein